MKSSVPQICSIPFKDENFETHPSRKRLTAEPSQFPGLPGHKEIRQPSKRRLLVRIDPPKKKAKSQQNVDALVLWTMAVLLMLVTVTPEPMRHLCVSLSDGTRHNVTVLSDLGAYVTPHDAEDLETAFGHPHPKAFYRVGAVPDAVHTVKLLQNALAHTKYLKRPG